MSEENNDMRRALSTATLSRNLHICLAPSRFPPSKHGFYLVCLCSIAFALSSTSAWIQRTTRWYRRAWSTSTPGPDEAT
ncbi:hypothetical protein M422DRAFT_36320, partial [Sphaerobolus stellatus SS14]